MLVEKRGDLFTTADPAIAHCIAADAVLTRGIAVAVKQRFPAVHHLRPFSAQIGQVIPVWDTKIIFNLVTKQHHYDKPTLLAIHWALVQLREVATGLGIRQISLPTIGSGLDGKRYLDVRPLLVDVFMNSDILVTVYIR